MDYVIITLVSFVGIFIIAILTAFFLATPEKKKKKQEFHFPEVDDNFMLYNSCSVGRIKEGP